MSSVTVGSVKSNDEDDLSPITELTQLWRDEYQMSNTDMRFYCPYCTETNKSQQHLVACKGPGTVSNYDERDVVVVEKEVTNNYESMYNELLTRLEDYEQGMQHQDETLKELQAENAKLRQIAEQLSDVVKAVRVVIR